MSYPCRIGPSSTLGGFFPKGGSFCACLDRRTSLGCCLAAGWSMLRCLLQLLYGFCPLHISMASLHRPGVYSTLCSIDHMITCNSEEQACGTELETQALYQKDLHAPATSFRRGYTCTVCPFSENSTCTDAFYLLSQRCCMQKPLGQPPRAMLR